MENAELTSSQDVAYLERIMIDGYNTGRKFLVAARETLLDEVNNNTYRFKVTSLLGPYIDSVESTLQESTVPLDVVCSYEADRRIEEIIEKCEYLVGLYTLFLRYLKHEADRQ